jgi:hypothetical protein
MSLNLQVGTKGSGSTERAKPNKAQPRSNPEDDLKKSRQSHLDITASKRKPFRFEHLHLVL